VLREEFLEVSTKQQQNFIFLVKEEADGATPHPTVIRSAI